MPYRPVWGKALGEPPARHSTEAPAYDGPGVSIGLRNIRLSKFLPQGVQGKKREMYIDNYKAL